MRASHKLVSRNVKLLTACCALLGTTLWGLQGLATAAEPGRDKVDFNRDIRRILSNKCFFCHGPDEENRKGGSEQGLRLDRREAAIDASSGQAAIVPGQPSLSALWDRINSTDPDVVMPPPAAGERLSSSEIAAVKSWIEQGAPYAAHWSFVPPVRPQLPVVRHTGWVRNEIDQFILAELEQNGLQGSPEAEKQTLARRVALDITGLPPAPDQVTGYLADQRADAFEHFVDELLARPSFGEHWGRMWLDLARYADSAGFADDPLRTIWLYRDYVIRAFNQNLPFDQFTLEQLAGDLLPHATEDQRIATAFHRNTLTNNEGGTSDEEFRTVAVVDRVNTTLSVWMGLTMACAQCHTHKYDPISQHEYFRFYAILNNTEDADRRDESPVYEQWVPELKRQRDRVQDELNAIHQIGTEDHPVSALAPGLQRQLLQFKPISTVPIMRELPDDKRRVTRIQHRGNFLDLGDVVEPGVPQAFLAPSARHPQNRLEMARWLVDEHNPLTARVIVNRTWESLFGSGIVRTSEEFGSQGDLPTHPELLDWLAVEFRESGWNFKQLVRRIVLSATYRQSTHVTPTLAKRDPDNQLYSRGPRVRLAAEAVRDQALAVSGLLSSKMFGEPVNPPQPNLGLNAAFGGGVDWKTSEGEQRYRRGIYTLWRRSNPYPSMATFDAPNREVCTLRRGTTNTPLQALVTLNDPVYVEAAQGLARRVAQPGRGIRPIIREMFQLSLLREPSDAEERRITLLYRAAKSECELDSDKARRLAEEPRGPDALKRPLAELAAWTIVANVLMNLDEFLMKP